MAPRLPLPGPFDEFFGELHDPRQQGSVDHPLRMILFCAFCAVLAGCTGWDSIAAFVRAKRSFFERFFDLSSGLPSADTIRRVFERVSPGPFRKAFAAWAEALAASLAGEVVNLDGKSLGGVLAGAGATTLVHLVHAWASQQQLLLGYVPVEGAPKETGAVEELLDLLCLAGAIVSGDANFCTQAIARLIRERGADYVLALKGNRGPIFEAVVAYFESHRDDRGQASMTTYRTSERGHGRCEERVVRVCSSSALSAGLRAKWCDVAAIVEVTRTRTVGDETSTERHYYLTSLAPDAEALARMVRTHWSVENQLHYVLDVAMNEDDCGVRDRVSAENLALVRRMALDKLRHPDAGKDSQVMKQRMAGWDESYLLKLLRLGPRPEPF